SSRWLHCRTAEPLPRSAPTRTSSDHSTLARFAARHAGESRMAQPLCQLKLPEELCWVADGQRPRKPDPAGLLWLTHALLRGAPRPARVLFLGATAGDQAASRAARDAGAPTI